MDNLTLNLKMTKLNRQTKMTKPINPKTDYFKFRVRRRGKSSLTARYSDERVVEALRTVSTLRFPMAVIGQMDKSKK